LIANIEIIDRYIRLSPGPYSDAVKNELYYIKSVQVREPGRAVRYEQERVDLYSDDSGYLLFPRGFEQRVKDFLDSKNVPHTTKVVSEMALPDADMSNLGELRPGQLEVLQAIGASKCGVVDALTGFGKGVMIEKVIKMYPNQTHGIFTKSKSVCNMLYERLSKVFPSAGCWNSSIHKKGNPIVCTVGSMGHIELDKIEVAQFDEVHQLVIPSFLQFYPKFKGSKFIAYSATPDDRMDNSALAVEGFFGPKLIKVDYQDGVKLGLVVPIEVFCIEAQGATTGTYFQDMKHDIARQRYGYWSNDARNNLIAKTVYEFLPKKISEKDPQILILVDKVEHALQLQKKLPDFKVAHGPMSADSAKRFQQEGLLDGDPPSKKDVEALQEAFSQGVERRAIATSIWSTGVDFPELAVIIRADGGASKIKDVQMPGRVARLAKGKDKGILIDFSDSFDAWALRRARSRRTNYESKGWSVIDVTL